MSMIDEPLRLDPSHNFPYIILQFNYPYLVSHSSGSSGQVRGAEKNEIYVATFGSHLFYDKSLQDWGAWSPRPSLDPLLSQADTRKVLNKILYHGASLWQKQHSHQEQGHLVRPYDHEHKQAETLNMLLMNQTVL